VTLPFTPDEFFDVLAAYNLRLWPFVLALWLLTLCALFAITRTAPARPWLIPGMLALHWAWSGLAYHAVFFSRVNPAAWWFAALFLVEAGLLFRYGMIPCQSQLFTGTSFRNILSWALIAYALLYPAIARAEGHAFPRLPMFGVPCPTTILTIGFLLAANRSWPRVLAIIPLMWAIVGGSAAFFFGVRADVMLIVAGIVLAVDIIRPVTILQPSRAVDSIRH
jgi:hypothetical protein